MGEQNVLRTAGQHDVDRMRLWRNQEANRRVSIAQHEISAAEHRDWWRRTQDDPTRRVLIYEADGRALGVVSFFDLRLDCRPRTGSWGFFLDHETVTAEGIAFLAWARVMGEAVDHAFDELGLDELHGEVLEDNHPVRAMNRRLRFTEGTPQVRRSGDRELSVIPISLGREARRRTERSSA
ncbi:MAG: GNAT family N-acetyltransferase [Nocardioidaceae bacterium]